jgi:hypothetical protein
MVVGLVVVGHPRFLVSAGSSAPGSFEGESPYGGALPARAQDIKEK